MLTFYFLQFYLFFNKNEFYFFNVCSYNIAIFNKFNFMPKVLINKHTTQSTGGGKNDQTQSI